MAVDIHWKCDRCGLVQVLLAKEQTLWGTIRTKSATDPTLCPPCVDAVLEFIDRGVSEPIAEAIAGGVHDPMIVSRSDLTQVLYTAWEQHVGRECSWPENEAQRLTALSGTHLDRDYESERLLVAETTAMRADMRAMMPEVFEDDDL